MTHFRPDPRGPALISPNISDRRAGVQGGDSPLEEDVGVGGRAPFHGVGWCGVALHSRRPRSRTRFRRALPNLDSCGFVEGVQNPVDRLMHPVDNALSFPIRVATNQAKGLRRTRKGRPDATTRDLETRGSAAHRGAFNLNAACVPAGHAPSPPQQTADLATGPLFAFERRTRFWR